MHKTIEPSILYFGTPVVLLTTLNEDGTPNVAPMSSAWWLGWNCMLGLGARSKTSQNILNQKECVLNLPADTLVSSVNKLARLTASDPVPPHKLAMGYRHEKNKFAIAGLTTTPSDLVKAPRTSECPVQLEAVLEQSHAFGPTALALQVRIIRCHVGESILLTGCENRINPDLWRPLMMSFCQFYGLGAQLQESTLAQIPEIAYRPAPHMSR